MKEGFQAPKAILGLLPQSSGQVSLFDSTFPQALPQKESGRDYYKAYLGYLTSYVILKIQTSSTVSSYDQKQTDQSHNNK